MHQWRQPLRPPPVTLQDKAVNERLFEITYLFARDPVADCKMNFIPRAKEVNMPGIINQVVGKPDLTVSDIPGAIERDIMLGLFAENGPITFEANAGAAERSGLKLSSRLLHLAREAKQ